MPFCRRCGFEVSEQARICSNCNFQLDQPIGSSAAAGPPSAAEPAVSGTSVPQAQMQTPFQPPPAVQPSTQPQHGPGEPAEKEDPGPSQTPAVGPSQAPGPPFGSPAQPWQAGGTAPGPYFGAPVRPVTDSGAILALVLGAAGVVFWPVSPVVSPIAIAVGSGARKRIDASAGNLAGRDLASAGFVLGIIGTVIAVVGIAFIIFLVSAFSLGGF